MPLHKQESEAAISLFVKKAKSDMKSKAESEMDHIDRKLDDLSRIVSVISNIYGREDITDNA